MYNNLVGSPKFLKSVCSLHSRAIRTPTLPTHTPFQDMILTTSSMFTVPEKSLSLEKVRERLTKLGRQRRQGQYFAKKNIWVQTGANTVPIVSNPSKHLSTCLTFKPKQPCRYLSHAGAPRHGQTSARAVLAHSLAFTDCTYGWKSFKAAQQVPFKTIRPAKRNQYNLLLTS